MKQFFTCSMLVLFSIATLATNPSDSTSKFFVGVSFNYFNVGLDLNSYSSQNWIDGENFGWSDWSDDEITQFNDNIKTQQYWLATSVVFGGAIYQSKNNPFSVFAQVQVGNPIFQHLEQQSHNGDESFKFQQKGINLYAGITLNMEYQFKNWSLLLVPSIKYIGVGTDNVDYNYLPEATYITEYEVNTSSIYANLDLLGAYKWRKFQILAGPGFFTYKNEIELTISKKTSLQTFSDDIKQEFISNDFLVGIVGYRWQIFNRFIWSSYIRIGNDKGFDSSFIYQF